jgi:hypothetical protein
MHDAIKILLGLKENLKNTSPKNKNQDQKWQDNSILYKEAS